MKVGRDGDIERPEPATAPFLRGLSLGALVGAAIAGSVLLRRGRMRSPEANVDAGRPGLEEPVSDDRTLEFRAGD